MYIKYAWKKNKEEFYKIMRIKSQIRCGKASNRKYHNYLIKLMKNLDIHSFFSGYNVATFLHITFLIGNIQVEQTSEII